jgi:hypothetical protein
MIRRALLAALLVAATSASAEAATADDLELWFDPDLTTYLRNKTVADLQFDGYQISSETALDVAGWDSISDRVPDRTQELIDQLGAGAPGFIELAPNSHQVSEGNILGFGVLKPGASFSIGKPFGEGGYSVVFSFKISGIAQELSRGVFVPHVPEPSTWLLATLAGLGLVAMRVRSKR